VLKKTSIDFKKKYPEQEMTNTLLKSKEFRKVQLEKLDLEKMKYDPEMYIFLF
jgi:hypothetical protein